MKTDPVGHARDPQEMVTESLEFLSQVTRYNRWMADTLDPHVGQRVLEFGCGTGNMLSHFLDRERVAGIDLDPALIRYCEESFAGEENCEFHCADIFRDEVELSVQPDTVIVPLLGVDAAGYRLGNGGGYYDMTLAARDPRPRIIGAGHDFCPLPTIFPQPWDIPMEVVLLGDGLRNSPSRPAG